MKPIRTAKTNTVFKLIGGTEDNDLCVFMGTEDGDPIVQSVWEPTDEERSALAAGANIELTVWGTGTPPVALRTTDVQPREPRPSDG
jgi:hypothetical protein